MWVRGALFALVLGGCYSPSFDTCSLACAADEACPNGYQCSNGRCAIEGSTCSLPDGGDDGMPIDNNTANCGDMQSQAGEICFESPVEIDTGLANISDAQFLDADGNGTVDIGFLGSAGYQFRLNTAGVFANVNTPGPTLPNLDLFLARSVGGTAQEELIHNNPAATGNVEIYEWGGAVWAPVANLASDTIALQGIAVGKTVSANGPDSIALVFGNRLRMYQLPTKSEYTPLTQSGIGFQIAGGRDVAIADTEADGASEIAVALTGGIDIFKNTNGTIIKYSSPPIGMTVDAVESCNVDGETDREFVYVIRAGAGTNGRVGVVRKSTGNTYELPAARDVENLAGVLDCADLDKDGFGDAMVVAGDGNSSLRLLVLRGRTDGTFDAPIEFSIPRIVTHIHVGDFNGDQVPDVVLTASVPGRLIVLESNP